MSVACGLFPGSRAEAELFKALWLPLLCADEYMSDFLCGAASQSM